MSNWEEYELKILKKEEKYKQQLIDSRLDKRLLHENKRYRQQMRREGKDIDFDKIHILW